MSAKIKILDRTAEISDADGRWHSDDKALEGVLETLRAAHVYSGADPNPALTLADEAVALLGGEVVSYDETEGDEIEPPEEGGDGTSET